MAPVRKLARGVLPTLDSGDSKPENGPRRPGEMALTGTRLQEQPRDAVNSRWFDNRYESSELESMSVLFDMQMAVDPGTADLAHIGRLAPNSQRPAEVEGKAMDKVPALDAKLEEQAATGDYDARGLHHQSKRESNASGGNSNERGTPMPSSLSGVLVVGPTGLSRTTRRVSDSWR